MSRHAEIPSMAPENLERNPEIVESRTTSKERKQVETIKKYQKDTVVMREKQAQDIVEAEIRINPDLDALIEKFKQEAEELRAQIDQLKEHDASLAEALELARAKIEHSENLKKAETKASQEETEVIPTETPVVETPAPAVTDTSPGILERLNNWLRGQGRPERESLSYSAYDRTQHPHAKAAREDARSASMENIADSALQANLSKLDQQRTELVQLEQQAASASFLTRWLYNGKVEQMKSDIRYTEAAIRARKAQLEKQTLDQAQAAK